MNSLQSSISSFFEPIMSIGLADEDNRSEQFRIRLSNFIVMNVIIIALYYGSYFLFFTDISMVMRATFVISFIVSLFLLYLNHCQYFMLSRVLVLFLSLAMIYATCLTIGFRSEAHCFLVAISSYGFLLMRTRLQTILVSAFILTSFAVLKVYLDTHGPSNPESMMPYSDYVNYMFSLLATSFTVAFIVNNHFRFIEDSNTQLEQKNAALRATNSQIEEQNNQLELFTSVASHDLRTPIRTISSFIGLVDREIEHGADPQKMKEYLSYASTGVKEMYEVISSISQVKKLSADDQFDTEMVDLNQEIESLKRKFNTSLYPDLTILAEQLPSIEVNRFHIITLFQNLIENAWKYNESPQKRVEISYERRAQEHILRFSDNGIGISEEYSQEIFKPFKKLHAKSVYAGSGMGLSICHRIVDLYDGDISVISGPEGGSIFTIVLPATSGDQ